MLLPRFRQARTAALIVALAPLLGCAERCLAQVLEPVPFEGLAAPPVPGADAGADQPTDPQAWRIQTIAIPETPKHIFGTGALIDLNRVTIETESGAWYRLADCASGLCAELVTSPHVLEQLPTGALPGSHVAVGQHRIARAWLAEPTMRLQGTTLGGAVAGALVVEDRTASSYRIDLGIAEAFEDRRPRIADLGPDHLDTVLVVKSSEDGGASLVAVGLTGEGLLQVLAESEPIGQPRGWLNPIGVADFTASGEPAIALVRTPDADGTLQILILGDHAFSTRFSIPNVSNHVPGTDLMEMAVIADLDGDGLANIAVPDASRQRVRILSFAHGQVAEPAAIDLPAPIATEMVGVAAAGKRPQLLMGLADGQLVLLH